jgi:5-methylcytosine-specific restriction endonuclease McrA
MKRCTKCRAEKEPAAFKTDRRRPAGLASVCRTCSAEANIQWRADNPAANSHRTPRKRSRPDSKERSERWRKANPERHRANDKAWRRANPEKARAIKAARIARKKGASGRHTGDEVKALFHKQRQRCAGCRASIKSGYHVDHIVPLRNCGSNAMANIQLLCPPCNLAKHAKPPEVWARENGRLL